MVQFDPPSPVAVVVSLNSTGDGNALVEIGRSALLTVTEACETPPFCRSTLNVPVVPAALCLTHSKTASITLALVTVNVEDVEVPAAAKLVTDCRISMFAPAPASAAANVAAPVRLPVPLQISVAMG